MLHEERESRYALTSRFTLFMCLPLRHCLWPTFAHEHTHFGTSFGVPLVIARVRRSLVFLRGSVSATHCGSSLWTESPSYAPVEVVDRLLKKIPPTPILIKLSFRFTTPCLSSLVLFGSNKPFTRVNFKIWNEKSSSGGLRREGNECQNRKGEEAGG